MGGLRARCSGCLGARGIGEEKREEESVEREVFMSERSDRSDQRSSSAKAKSARKTYAAINRILIFCTKLVLFPLK